MIRNIVLDMGNVLLDYNPEVCLKKFLSNEEDRAIIRRELFEGPEWRLGDLGYLKDEERYAPVSARVPERLHPQLKQCVEQWDMCMLPLPGAREFCETAKKQGFRLYVLSNASDAFYRYFPNFRPFNYFDGIVVSADIHICKPDIRIYQYLTEQYGLKPEECFFIDDRDDNVEGAKNAGMDGAVFRGDFREIAKLLAL